MRKQKFRYLIKLIMLSAVIMIAGAEKNKAFASFQLQPALTNQEQYFANITAMQKMFYKTDIKEEINLNINNAPLMTALRTVAEKTGMKLTLRGDILPDVNVTVIEEGIWISDALDKILSDTGLDFRISREGYLLIIQKDGEEIEAILMETVIGVIRDAVDGTPVPGATIVVQGSRELTGSLIGTNSNTSGEFEINVPEGLNALVITSVGYITKTVEIGSATQINVTLERALEMLDDIVVVGYGMQRQERITGSIASIRSEQLDNQPITNLSTVLQGQASGVEIVRGGGAPGTGGAIRIRGTGTVNDANPLIVIDGMPSDLQSLNNINSDDVESIDILKDASSAAVYGNRAANGVILVTTKRGRFNQDLQVRFNSSIGYSRPINTIDVLDAPTLAMLKRERFTNDGLPVNPIWEDQTYQTQRTNWQDELLGTGSIQDYNLSIQGGSSNSSFYISGNFADEQGMMKSSYFDRYGLKINSFHRVGSRINLRQNLSLTRTNGNTLNTLSAQTGVLWSAIRFHPGLPVQNEDGSYGSSQISGEFGDINNPIFTIEQDSDSNTERRRVLGNVEGEIDLFEGLSLRGSVGLDYAIDDFYQFFPVIDRQIRARPQNELNRSYTEGTSVSSELFLHFRRTIAQNHDIDGLAGIVQETFKGENFSALRRDFKDESPTQRVLNSGNIIAGASGTTIEDALLSYLGRVNYALANKYLLSASIRYDGSSRFSSNNRWGVFPAVSAGWRISEESFFDNLRPVINNMRLTAGWGRSGNQSIARHQFLGLYAQNARYSFQGAQVNGISQTRIPNRNISWESVEMINFGVHTRMYNDRINASVEYFIRDSKDVLLAPPILAVLGTASVPDVNVGEIRNQGLEIELGYSGQVGEINFSVSGNASFIRNEVTNLNNDFLGSVTYGRPNQEIARTFQGHPIATFYGWSTNGLYQNQQEIDSDPNISNDPRRANIRPGDVRFVDLNGDGVINADDRKILGSPHPDMTYGLSVSSGYKNLNLNLHFVGAAGVDIFNADRMQGIDPTYPFNMYAETENRWNGQGSSNTIPRMTTLRNNLNHRASDLFIESGSYFRLKSFTLGYTLPNSITEIAGLRGVRFYVTGINVFTITPYSGIDPELGYTDGNLQRNVDYAQYPQPRTWTFGTVIDF